MTAKEFMKAVANGKNDIIQVLLDILTEADIPYCVIDGFAVNAYVEPVVSLDLDIVVIAGQVEQICAKAAEQGLKVERFPHSINLSSTRSDLRRDTDKGQQAGDDRDRVQAGPLPVVTAQMEPHPELVEREAEADTVQHRYGHQPLRRRLPEDEQGPDARQQKDTEVQMVNVRPAHVNVQVRHAPGHDEQYQAPGADERGQETGQDPSGQMDVGVWAELILQTRTLRTGHLHAPDHRLPRRHRRRGDANIVPSPRSIPRGRNPRE